MEARDRLAEIEKEKLITKKRQQTRNKLASRNMSDEPELSVERSEPSVIGEPSLDKNKKSVGIKRKNSSELSVDLSVERELSVQPDGRKTNKRGKQSVISCEPSLDKNKKSVGTKRKNSSELSVDLSVERELSVQPDGRKTNKRGKQSVISCEPSLDKNKKSVGTKRKNSSELSVDLSVERELSVQPAERKTNKRSKQSVISCEPSLDKNRKSIGTKRELSVRNKKTTKNADIIIRKPTWLKSNTMEGNLLKIICCNNLLNFNTCFFM